MVAEESPDWLPAGWTEQLVLKDGQEVKHYFNIETGQKFYSKNDLIRYVGIGISKTPEQKNNHEERCSEDKSIQMAIKTNETPGCIVEWKAKSSRRKHKLNMDQLTGAETSMDLKGSQILKTPNWVVAVMTTPDELPPGWIKEMKIEKKENGIRKDPYYTDPISGYVFRSMKDALRYVETGDISRCAIKPKKREEMGFLNADTSVNMDQLTGAETSTNLKGSQILKTPKGISCEPKQNQITSRERSSRTVVTVMTTPDELPPGWIKEMKIEKKGMGIRKDPYYTDPVSGYVFRSMKDALRYVEIGDISRCAIRPKKRDEMEFLNTETSVNMDQLTGAETSTNLKGSQIVKTPRGISSAPKQNQITFREPSSRRVVTMMTTPDELPPGWIKEMKVEKKGNGIRKDPVDMEQLVRAETSMDQEGSQNIKTPKGISCASKPNQIIFGDQSLRKVVIVMTTPDELPPGWIKEMKIEKKGNGIRKDPYYTDPVSGYVFRSMKDALRYVETGDISRCSIKPKKREEVGFLNGKASLSSATNMVKRGNHTRQGDLKGSPSTKIARKGKSRENVKRKNNSSKVQTRRGSAKSMKKHALASPRRSSKRLAELKPAPKT